MAKRTEGQLLQLLIPFFKSCFQPQNIGNKITILGFLSFLISGFKVLCKYYVLFMTYINIIVTAVFQIFHKIILKFVEKKIEQAMILFFLYITNLCVHWFSFTQLLFELECFS